MFIADTVTIRALRRVLVLTSSIAAMACGSSKDDPAPTGGTGPVTCETNPNRPAALYDMTKALKDAADGKADPATITIDLVPNHWSPFWMTPSIGVGVAKREIGCAADMSAAALKGDPDAVKLQIDKLNGLIDQKVSGIGLSCKDAVADVDPISRAVAANIPVITFDSDAAKGDMPPYYGGRSLYLGSLNAPAGKAAAGKVTELIGGSGNVLVISSSPKEANFQQRVDGFLEGINGTQVHADVYLLGDEYAAFVQAEPDPSNPSMDINAFLTDHLKNVFSAAPPAAIFATNGTYGPVVAAAVLDSRLSGQVHVVAFDLSTDTQHYLQSRVISAAVVQKSFYFGYLGAYVLYGMAVNGAESTLQTLAPWMTGDLLDTGVDLVTPDTLDAYTKYQIECLGIPSL